MQLTAVSPRDAKQRQSMPHPQGFEGLTPFPLHARLVSRNIVVGCEAVVLTPRYLSTYLLMVFSKQLTLLIIII